MSYEADVLVVGAGPAGCGAAFDLCRDGLSVLLLEKASFPRVKPCGGALTIKTLKTLRYSVAPVVRDLCYGFKAGLRLDPPVVFSSDYPIAAMTVRSEFDEFCVRQCVDEGVRFHTKSEVTSLGRGRTGWEVRTRRDVFRGRYLIGADGANSRVRRLLGLSRHAQRGFAIETTIPAPAIETHDMQMDFGVVDRGYAWIFPKRDHWNVGLFTQHKSIRGAARRLADYCLARLGVRPTGPLHFGVVPYGGRYGPPARHPRALLVGDAASLVDPLLGEGIYNAVRSGQIAAAAIRDMIRHGKNTYRRRLREITLDLMGSTSDSGWFYQDLDRGYDYLRQLPIRYCLMKGMGLGMTFRQTKRMSFVLPFMRPVGSPRIDNERAWGPRSPVSDG
jgi:geranylgeranyl reductase family protein